MPVITAGRFAAATSVLALVVAMGGTGYAAIKIGGNQIKKNAITSKHVKNNSLTGKDIKESSLAKVPSAANADSAGSVDGVSMARVFYRSASATPTTIFSAGGLTISASCTANDLTLTALSGRDNSSIYSYWVDLETDALQGGDLETQNFDNGQPLDLLSGDNDATQDPALVHFVYDTADGHVITGTLSTDNADGGPNQCSVTGTVSVA